MLTVTFFLEFVYSLYFSSVLVNLHVLSYQSSLSPLQGSPRVNTERNYAASILSRILPCDLLTYSPSCPIELILELIFKISALYAQWIVRSRSND